MRSLARTAALLSIAVCLPVVVTFAQTPASNHVFILVEENHSYSQVVGNTADMPYLNGLISKYGLATQYYANTLGSIPDYFMLTSGQALETWSVQNIDNIVRELLPLGKTWKSYAESLPAVGWASGNAYPYTQEHNPFALFSDVVNSSNQINNLVPFSHFATDLSGSQLPNYSFIIPNQQNNAHDCPAGLSTCTDHQKLANADQWLKNNIDPLIRSAVFQQDGILVILFDESDGSDSTHGGGRVEWAVIGPRVKPGYQSTFSYYQNQSTLRLTCDALGIVASSCPAAGATAPAMGEFFSSSTTTTGAISGTVRNSATGAAISGATVSYSGGNATTNSSGAYTLSNVPAGSVSVTASASGFTSSSATVSVTAGATTTQNFALSAILITTTGTISGTVTSAATGAAISAATVSYSGGSTTTNTSGAYTLSNVPAGSVPVTASATGFNNSSATASVTAGATTTQNFALTASAVSSAGGHVFIVMEENHNYSSIVGNTAAMPYLNSLIAKYGLATNYYANTHPSIGNYFMLTTGQIISNDDAFTGTVTADNIVRELTAASKSWKSYAESLPSVGYTGGDVYPYIKHHNPFTYFSDVLNSSTQARNLVPFTQFTTDLANNQLPNYSFIVPNLQDDTHDCPAGMSTCTDTQILANADQWLKNNIDPLINSAVFQQDGILVITWDEADQSNTTNGGGQVAWVVLGPRVKGGYRSTTFYQHASTLRMMCNALGITTCPGAGATAPTMGEFFSSSTTTTGTISGTVTNAATGAAISGATVSYSGGSTTTNSSGAYTLSNVPAGSVSVTASATGFSSSSATVSVTAGATTTRNFALTAVATTGTISGTVTNAATGAAISGATVSYSGGSTTTNSSGAYTLSNVPAGSVSLTASATGFSSSSATVSVTAGATTTRNFALTAVATTGTISGTVTNAATGAAISGATVSYSGGSTTTNSSGAYTLSNVPAGSVSVTASATGFSSSSATVSVTAGATTTQNFALKAVATTGTISGKVTSAAAGAAISGATVSYSGGSTTTNSSGAYTLSNVPAGGVSLTASATGYNSSNTTVSVIAGTTTTQNFSLVATGTISGKPTIVQHAANIAIGATSVRKAFAANVTAGDLLYAYCRNGTGDPLSLSDSLGQKWTLVTSVFDGSGGTGAEQVFVWYVANSAGGADTVTCSGPSSANLEVGMVEVSGVATSTPLDQTVTSHGNGTSPATSSVTTTTANEILLVACTWPFTTNLKVTAGSGWTLLDNPLSGGDTGGADEAEMVSFTGSYTAAFTLGSAVNWGCILTTFKGS